MPLVKARGNMYNWIDYTHCHLGGQCPHECSYCYVDHFPYGRPKKYQGELRLIEKELSVNYESGNKIFVENCNDIMAKEVPQLFINKIIHHCLRFPDNEYIFQTKNPERYLTMAALFPSNSILGATIETNRHYPDIMKNAPPPFARALALSNISCRKFLTIEPILDFDVDILSYWIKNINPNFVNIGADSKRHNLPEPPADKIKALIAEIKNAGIEVKIKSNLSRLFAVE